MAKHEAAWWAERIEELSRGATAAELARRYGVRERTLIWWRSELARRGRKKAKPRLLPVVVTPRRVEALRPELEVIVEVGAARLVMRGNVTGEHLAAIVASSARAC